MIRDPAQIKNSNIWEKAGKTTEPLANTQKRTIIMLGQQKSGKTSLIKILKGDFDLQSKPTRLIDYFSTKKQGVQIEFYQISSPKFETLLDTFIKIQNSANLTIVLCIDLTIAENLVTNLNTKIEELKIKLKQILSNKKIDQNKEFNQTRSKMYQYIEKHQDNQIIKRFPFKFMIIGCKYDLFQKMKIQQKKWIARCLRYIAHVNEADLLFSSSKNLQVCAQLRNIFTEEILGVRSNAYSNQKDHNKPLFILTGQDKIGQMSLPAFNNSGAFNELKILQQQLESVFPSKKHIELKQQENIEKSFRPIGLDSLISRQRKQIMGMMRQKKIVVESMKNMVSQKIFYGQGMGMTGTNGFKQSSMKIVQKRGEQQLQQSKQEQKVQRKNKNNVKQQTPQQQQYMDQEEGEQYEDEDA